MTVQGMHNEFRLLLDKGDSFDAPSFLIVSGVIGGGGFYIDTYSSEQMDWFAGMLEMIGGMLFLYACIVFGKKDRKNILD